MRLSVDRRMVCAGGLTYLAGLWPGRPAAGRDPVERAVTRAAADPAVPGVILRHETAQGGRSWTAGRQRRDGGPALRPATPFHIASIGKLLTATAVLQQAERGTLDLDDLVIDHLGAASLRGLAGDAAPALTLRHLLGHRSGLPDLDNDPGFQNAVLHDPQRIWTPQDLLEVARGLPPTGRPGAQTSYSSTNYHLLGLVLERVTGTAYANLIRRDILAPLGLGRTWHSVQHWPAARAAQLPPLHHYAGTVDLTEHHPSFEFADGGFVSTATDLTRFGRLLAQGAPFADPGTWARMIEAETPRPDGLHQALGPMVAWQGGAPRVALHGGFWGLGLKLDVAGAWATVAATGQAEADPWPLMALTPEGVR
ncbi:serine hydrolase domain-containing protein [Dinoroseobacter sp. S124A]|uniref:serine hydrolase domain-containing protein n=1 Tax=Dinoroseobacter sp. S124A TaxID=3415128 RepID=UPI003C7B4C13